MTEEILRTAIVTGAAGAIGSACVRRLFGAGMRVLAVDVESDRLDPVRALGDEAAAGEIVAVVADISSREGADAAIAAAGGRIDVLVNVAGVGDGLMNVDELDDDTWDRVIRVNQTSAYLMMRRAIPVMLDLGGGVIVNMSSAAGLRGGRAGFAYTASKWALVGMSQNVAASHGPAGIRCHAICPSRIEGAQTLARGRVSPTAAVRTRRDTGKPAAGTPDDVAASLMFLISDEARHLNGVALPVDAGWLAY